MLTLRFTAGVGVGVCGACGPPLVWRARKPLPCALRSSASLALGLERRRAPVPEHRLPVLGLCLRPHWMSTSLLFSISLLFLLVRVALKLRSLRFHSPRLCRIAVFLIQTIVSLAHYILFQRQQQNSGARTVAINSYRLHQKRKAPVAELADHAQNAAEAACIRPGKGDQPATVRACGVPRGTAHSQFQCHA